jgi:hypothetical protein
MRSPSEHFIKFLISQDKHDTNMILRILEDYGLDGISSMYVDGLRARMDPIPEPNLSDRGFKDWLRRHGIRDLWFPNNAVQEAYTILSEANLRSTIQALLLSPLRLEDITKRINKRFEINLSPEGVQAFGHYFWNKKLLSQEEWVGFLDGRTSAYESITVMRASPDVATAVVPWVTGVGGIPQDLNTGVVARRVRDVAFLKVLEIERQPATLAHSKMMKNYHDVIRGMEAEMRQSDVALKDVLKAFEKFRLRKDSASVPSIEEVAGPNFSRSGEGTDDVHDLAEDPWPKGGPDDDDDAGDDPEA